MQDKVSRMFKNLKKPKGMFQSIQIIIFKSEYSLKKMQ